MESPSWRFLPSTSVHPPHLFWAWRWVPGPQQWTVQVTPLPQECRSPLGETNIKYPMHGEPWSRCSACTTTLNPHDNL